MVLVSNIPGYYFEVLRKRVPLMLPEEPGEGQPCRLGEARSGSCQVRTSPRYNLSPPTTKLRKPRVRPGGTANEAAEADPPPFEAVIDLSSD